MQFRVEVSLLIEMRLQDNLGTCGTLGKVSILESFTSPITAIAENESSTIRFLLFHA